MEYKEGKDRNEMKEKISTEMGGAKGEEEPHLLGTKSGALPTRSFMLIVACKSSSMKDD